MTVLQPRWSARGSGSTTCTTTTSTAAWTNGCAGYHGLFCSFRRTFPLLFAPFLHAHTPLPSVPIQITPATVVKPPSVAGAEHKAIKGALILASHRFHCIVITRAVVCVKHHRQRHALTHTQPNTARHLLAEAKERDKEQAEQAEKLGETLEEAGIRTRRQKQKGMVRRGVYLVCCCFQCMRTRNCSSVFE